MNSKKNPDLNSGYVKDYYDSFLKKLPKEYGSHRWQDDPVSRIHYKQTAHTLLPLLEKMSGTVLEIGGGDGFWTMRYIKNVEQLTFLDISSEMVVRAKKRLEAFQEKIIYLNSDFLQNNFSDNYFDNIISIRNLEYFTDKEKFISEVKRLLKNGGTFLLVTKSPHYSLKNVSENKTLHQGQVDIKELVALIENKGLKIVAVRPAIFGKLFRFSFIRFISTAIHRILMWLPWKIIPLRPLSYLSESFTIYVKK